MIITVDAAAKAPKTFKGRTKYGVKPVGKDYWIDLYVDFRPEKGQTFDVNIKETQGKNGMVFRDAEIIAAAPKQAAPATPPPPSNNGGMTVYANPPSNGKIKWSEWVEMARAASQLSYELEPDLDAADLPTRPSCEARAALVNTVMIAFSNGKLELPTEAGPVSRESGDDQDEAYKDANNVLPPEWGR